MVHTTGSSSEKKMDILKKKKKQVPETIRNPSQN